MKTNPQRYFDVLGLSPRLALAVPDANALRYRRRVESGMRAFFASGEGDWMALARTHEHTRRRDRRN